MLEIDNLKARNHQGLLRFVDINDAGFDPTPFRATLAEMKALIHAQRPDGSLVIGVGVFRLAYAAVVLGHFTHFTAWPIFKPLVDAAYLLFARHRMLASRIATPFITWLAAGRALGRSGCDLHVDFCDASHTDDFLPLLQGMDKVSKEATI
jgi:predicted DCC family thiol-disulfide oxidoreductase YuxK